MHAELFRQTSVQVVNGKIIGKYARMDPHSTLPWTKFNLIAGAIIPAVMKYVSIVYATDKRWDSRERSATHLSVFHAISHFIIFMANLND